jgi:hypothetical protein
VGGPVTRLLGERMRVLGIDPGLTRCGLGVVDGVPGRQPLHGRGRCDTYALGFRCRASSPHHRRDDRKLDHAIPTNGESPLSGFSRSTTCRP